MRKLSKEEALVYSHYHNYSEAAIAYLQGKNIQAFAKELTFTYQGNELIVSKNEVKAILNNLAKENILFAEKTINELLKKDGKLIYQIENPSLEQQLIALDVLGIKIFDIIYPTKKLCEAALIKNPLGFFNYTNFHKLSDIFNKEEIKVLLKQNADIATIITEDEWDKDMLYGYLEQMVKENRAELLCDYQRKLHIPESLKDPTYYRAYGMVNGYNIQFIPNELVTQKLLMYSLTHGKSFIGHHWLFKSIEEKHKTKEICLMACFKHFANVSFLPEKFQTTDFYDELIAAGQCNLSGIDTKKIPTDYLKKLCIKGYYKGDIPKSLWDEELAISLVKLNNAKSIIPKKWQTREWFKHYLAYYGAWKELPENMQDEEMALCCIQSHNRLSLEGIPEEYKTSSFWKEVIKHGKIEKIKDLPKDYRTPENILYLAEIGAFYPYKGLKEEAGVDDAVLENILLKLYKHYPRHYVEILANLQTPVILETLYSSLETKYQKFYAAKQLKEVPASWLEDFIPEFAETIFFKGMTTEMKQKSIHFFPENILYLESDVSCIPPTMVNLVDNSITKNIITNTTIYEQITLWDLLNN